jgi:hypothetical protein
LDGIQGKVGLEGIQGPTGPAGEVTVVTDDGGSTTITGPPGNDGADGVVSIKYIRLTGAVSNIILPAVADVPESGLHYYKDGVHETDLTFSLPNGLIVAKFYAIRLQNITFLKSGNTWIN